MFSSRWFSSSLWVGAAALLLCAATPAQSLPPGVQLGMSAGALQAALPDLQRVARPQRPAGGLAGSWRGTPTAIAGLSFEPVFYFAGAALRRVEWVAAADNEADHGAAAFEALRVWGRERFGAEMVTHDPGSRYAAWVDGDTDIYAQHVDGARGATVRLVYKSRQTKDAGEL